MLHYSHTLIMPCITCSSPIIFIFSLSFNTLQNALMQQHSSFSPSNKPLHKGGHLVLPIASNYLKIMEWIDSSIGQSTVI